MRASERANLERILEAVAVHHERELPGAAQRSLRMMLRLWPAEMDGVVALVDFARTAGYTAALADVDALGALMADLDDSADLELETPGPAPPAPATSFTCPTCSAVSFNPNDIAQGYCGRCHAFTGDRR